MKQKMVQVINAAEKEAILKDRGALDVPHIYDGSDGQIWVDVDELRD
jgi:hypothetical protein